MKRIIAWASPLTGRDTVSYFKSMAEETGIPYQNLINLYLRDCAVHHRKLHMKWHPESAELGAWEGLGKAVPCSAPYFSHLSDAEKKGIENKNIVKIISRRGEIKARVSITKRSPEGTVFIPFHFGEMAVNLLTNDALDPVSRIPEFKVCAVAIERV